MYIGLKKLAVVPVTYREKIRVGIGHIYKIRCISTINSVFKLKLFVLVLWPSGPEGDGFHAIAWGSIPDIAYFILFKSKFFF